MTSSAHARTRSIRSTIAVTQDTLCHFRTRPADDDERKSRALALLGEAKTSVHRWLTALPRSEGYDPKDNRARPVFLRRQTTSCATCRLKDKTGRAYAPKLVNNGVDDGVVVRRCSVCGGTDGQFHELQVTDHVVDSMRAIVDAAFRSLEKLIDKSGRVEAVAPITRALGVALGRRRSTISARTWSEYLPFLQAAGVVLYDHGRRGRPSLIGFPLMLALGGNEVRDSLQRRARSGFGVAAATVKGLARGGAWWQPMCWALLDDDGRGVARLDDYVAGYDLAVTEARARRELSVLSRVGEDLDGEAAAAVARAEKAYASWQEKQTTMEAADSTTENGRARLAGRKRLTARLGRELANARDAWERRQGGQRVEQQLVAIGEAVYAREVAAAAENVSSSSGLEAPVSSSSGLEAPAFIVSGAAYAAAAAAGMPVENLTAAPAVVVDSPARHVAPAAIEASLGELEFTQEIESTGAGCAAPGRKNASPSARVVDDERTPLERPKAAVGGVLSSPPSSSSTSATEPLERGERKPENRTGTSRPPTIRTAVDDAVAAGELVAVDRTWSMLPLSLIRAAAGSDVGARRVLQLLTTRGLA